jgi:hypothetical protein
MSSFYNVPIPTPANLRKLAQIIDEDGEVTVIHWCKLTSQIVVQQDDDRWIQPNGPVTESLAAIFDCDASNIIAKNLFLFETPGHGKAADEELTVGFYDCEWSDYANDHIAIEFDLVINESCTSNAKRLVKALRVFIDDEEEDEIPDLEYVDDAHNTAFRVDDDSDIQYNYCCDYWYRQARR